MKKVLAFDIDQTLNIAKTPIPPEIAELLTKLLDYYEICPISGQKFDQFLVQIIEPLYQYARRDYTPGGATSADLQRFADRLAHLHLFVAQGTQYYKYDAAHTKQSGQLYDAADWELVYNYPLADEEAAKITRALEQSAKELGYWEEDKLAPGDEIIENRLSQVTFSALGQTASTDVKYAWDPDYKKREQIVARCRELAPEFQYEIGGTTSINAFTPGMNKQFGMNHLMQELGVTKPEILYFGDMTQPGGNDYPVVQMGIETITVENWQDTARHLEDILASQKPTSSTV